MLSTASKMRRFEAFRTNISAAKANVITFFGNRRGMPDAEVENITG